MNCRKLASLVITMVCLLLPLSAGAATQAEINQAIQRGITWLATQQNSDGSFGSGYNLAYTTMAVLAFENEGHFPGGGTAYSANVEKGLAYIFARARSIAIQPQVVGYPGRNDNPDSNGNNTGVYFSQSSLMYETGLAMQAIAASNTPNRVVTTGPCTGRSYRDMMVDLVDFVAWAQIDGGPGRGGWRYNVADNASGYADNSVAQWPVLGLVAAQQWGIQVPQFVKNELHYWVTFIQNADGSSGYDVPTTYPNVSKTGGLLVEFFLMGDNATTDRAKRALGYLDAHWNDELWPWSVWDGNKGHPYAMYSVFKGLELMKVAAIPSAPANADTAAGDWWGDYADYLVHAQLQTGNWDGYSYYWNTWLASPWYIIILQASVFPVSVDIYIPGASCDLTGYDSTVNYNVERFTANGTVKVYRDDVLYDTITLTDFKGKGTKNYTVTPESIGSHSWKAVLEVTGGGIPARAEDTVSGKVFATPQVSGIPNQVAPFSAIRLDDYETCRCASVDWSASNVPAGWTVTIDPATHIATVAAPPGATTPATITFKAVFHWPGIDCTGSQDVTFSPNRPPRVVLTKSYPSEDYEVAEGSTVLLDGTPTTDPDGNALTYFGWDLDGDGMFEATTPRPTTVFSAVGKDGPSQELYIHLKVCDEFGACGVGTAEVEIENVAPTVQPLLFSHNPAPVNTVVNFSAAFTDPGVPDTHTAVCSTDAGGTAPVATVVESGGNGTAMSGYSYALPGVYTVRMTVTDKDGGQGATESMLVVYDPDAGFVTGGGWIDSPAGAYHGDPTLSGKANFGFVSKYQKNATVPTGETEFQFHVANVNFHSNAYEYLIVTGSNYAKFKGAGTINGQGSYKFMIWAKDGAPDMFRIKIWTETAAGVENVIYDNASDQPIAGGSIVIHTK